MKETFSYEAKNHTLVIHMPAQLDHHNSRDLRYETDLLLAENYINRIVFDFSETEFMDSSGLAILTTRYKQMKASRGRTAFYGAGAQVMRILKIAGITGLMEQYRTEEEALAN